MGLLTAALFIKQIPLRLLFSFLASLCPFGKARQAKDVFTAAELKNGREKITSDPSKCVLTT